jgi:hypothetical protein
MKKSRFSEDQSRPYWEKGEQVLPWQCSVANTASVRLHTTSGRARTAACRPTSSSGSRSLRQRTPSSSIFAPSWPWRTQRSRTCYPENCDAYRQACGSVGIMFTEHDLSRANACRTVKPSQEAFYKTTVDRLAKDASLVEAPSQVLVKRSRRGFWKCFDRLRAEGRPRNHTRVHRVYSKCQCQPKFPHSAFHLVNIEMGANDASFQLTALKKQAQLVQ